MEEPIEESYFNWLCSKIDSVDVPTPSSTHWKLLKELHTFEFVWLLPGDDNRAEDGMDVRREFLLQSHLDDEPYWINLGCSLLEMLIAFSRRAEFLTDLDAEEWFWIFMVNLGLDEFSDARLIDEEIDEHIQPIADILERFVWRTYSRNGFGGLFPLENPEYDQRKVELWFQLCGWISEKNL